MFELPTVGNLVISTVAFFVVTRYLHQYLQAKGLFESTARSVLVFLVASILSSGIGDMVDWAQAKIQGSQSTVQKSVDLTELFKMVNRIQSS